MKKNKNLIRITGVAMLAGLSASVASVPHTSQITNDTAIYQNLHEIRISKEKSLDFDGDIERLSAQEKSHRRALPVRVSAPMERVMKSSYKPSASLSKKRTLRSSSQSH